MPTCKNEQFSEEIDMFITFVENILIMGTCLNYFKNKYKQSIGDLELNKKKMLLLVLSHKI